MKQIKIGGKFEASAVSLGCMRMATLNEKEIDSVINTALDNGIDFFDHANIYGAGECERLFGEFLKRNATVRDKIKIQTNRNVIF